jgi:hypothetical protein
MKARDRRDGSVLNFRNGVELVDYLLPPAEEEYAMREAVCGLLGRMLDHMNLTDQQKLDIVVPYESWEVLK